MSLFLELQALVGNVPDSLIYKEIMHADLWESWLSQMDDPSRPRPTKHQLIKDWIGDRWDEFLNDLTKEAVEVDGKLVVHRCIEVKDPEAFVRKLRSGRKLKRGLGIYWTWNFRAADCHWGTARGTRLYLTGLVDLDSIEIESTVLSNFHPSTGPDEKEIRLYENQPILLTGISLSEEDPRWQFDPAIPVRS